MRKPLALRLVPVLVPGVFLAALPHLSFGPFRILAVLQALLPLWCVAALLACLVLALRRAFVTAAVLLVLAAASLAPVVAPSVGSVTGTTCTPGEQVRVLSLNAEHGRADTSSLAEVIRGSAPDVLVLVESSEPMLTALAAGFPAWEYTHRTGKVVTGGSADTVILSRHPLQEEAAAVLQSNGALFDVPVAVIVHPLTGPIRVAGVHPAPPTYSPSSWAGTLHDLGAWKHGQTGMPLVMAGDFNATAAHPQFRALAAGLAEASPRLGPWAGATWPADMDLPAFAGIDHVLVRGLTVLGSERFSVPGTDHHGIVARLASCR